MTDPSSADARASRNPRSDAVDQPVRRFLTRQASDRFRREDRHWFRHLLSLVVARVLSWVARALPDRARTGLADWLGDRIHSISVQYRENVADNLTQVAAYTGDDRTGDQVVRSVFRVASQNWADLLMVPGKTRQEMSRDIRLVDGSWDILDQALALRRGAVLITAHLGAFDFIGQVLHARGYALTAVTLRTTSRVMFDGVTALRRSHGMRLVEATPSGVRTAIQAIRRGECSVFVTDRDFFQNGRPVSLFGRETTLPPGAVRIARDSRAPIVPIFTRRVGSIHELMIYDAFEVPRSSDIDADIDAGLQKIVDVLERAISTAPDQWVMFQSVWPSEPADLVRAFPAESPLSGEFAERVGASLPRLRPPPSVG
jgi:KDO2-lipid IV(A) lauroyltransferase